MEDVSVMTFKALVDMGQGERSLCDLCANKDVCLSFTTHRERLDFIAGNESCLCACDRSHCSNAHKCEWKGVLCSFIEGKIMMTFEALTKMGQGGIEVCNICSNFQRCGIDGICLSFTTYEQRSDFIAANQGCICACNCTRCLTYLEGHCAAGDDWQGDE